MTQYFHKIFIKNAIAVLLFLLPLFVIGQQNYTIQSVPDPKRSGTGYVSNPDGILNPAEVQRLNRIIGGLEDASTAQIAVVIINSIGQENPKDFATRLFEHWGIGQADKDNGLLILSVMNQRRTEFETGYGLEGPLPDVYCYRIGMQELVPHFKNGEYGKGLIAAILRIQKILENPDVLEEIRSGGRQQYGFQEGYFGLPLGVDWYIIAHIVFGVALLIWILLVLYDKEDLYDKYMALFKTYHWWLILLFPLVYPLFYFYLKGQLKKLREQPRYSQVNGQLMRKLKEDEDDSFLTPGQISEEEIGSVDYDVWVTEDLEDALILRYARRFSKYKSCPKCAFTTYYLARTQTLRHATYHSSGQRLKRHECKNCHYQHEQLITIPRKQRSSGGGGFSSGGGGGGGSWGGGSSGGGGGGVSW